jgi:methionyl-tRNA formyltransferase
MHQRQGSRVETSCLPTPPGSASIGAHHRPAVVTGNAMRFAITGCDRYLAIFEAFVRAGWRPLRLFTSHATSEHDNQRRVVALARQQGAAIQLSRLTTADLAQLREQECDALIVASYNWKICDWRPYLKYAVNFHCSPLPEGRGPYPITRAILEKRESWAITCHKLTSDIDNGDILAAESFPLRPDECHESLDLKVQMAAGRLAKAVATRFTELWEHAEPQKQGTYWKLPGLEERVIDFRKPVEEILLHIRAYGAIGSVANIGKHWLLVRRAVGWSETHSNPLGCIMHVFNRAFVVAVSDGYLGVMESTPMVTQQQTSVVNAKQ